MRERGIEGGRESNREQEIVSERLNKYMYILCKRSDTCYNENAFSTCLTMETNVLSAETNTFTCGVNIFALHVPCI